MTETTSVDTNFTLLAEQEIAAAKALLVENRLFTEHTRIAYMGLEDPSEQNADRLVRVMLMDKLRNEPKDVVLDVTRGEVASVINLDPAAVGQLPVLVGALALFCLGNFLMVQVMKANGLGLAIALSAIFQLVAISVMAIFVFGERPTGLQLAGMALGCVAVAMIAWPTGGKA